MMWMGPYRVALVVTVFALSTGVARADEVVVDSRQALQQAVREAEAGARIVIAPGRYEGGLHFDQLRGEAGRPIVIAGQDADDPPRFVGGGNGLHLSHPQHVTLENLVFEQTRNNGLNIDDGGTMEASAVGITLRGVTVRDVQGNGNHDGMKLSGLTDFRIENCTIEQWGDAGQGIDMVGCHRGVIVNTTLRDGTIPTAVGIQAKGSSSEIVIRDCLLDSAGGRALNIGGSTGMDYFRPQPPRRWEAKDITVTGCTIIGGDAAVAFVGINGATFTGNTIYRPRRWVFRVLQETVGNGFVPSRRGRIEGNLIVFRADEVRAIVNVGPHTAVSTFKAEGNWWYCEDVPNQSRPSMPIMERDGVYGTDPELRDPAGGDLQPQNPDARRYGASAAE